MNKIWLIAALGFISCQALAQSSDCGPVRHRIHREQSSCIVLTPHTPESNAARPRNLVSVKQYNLPTRSPNADNHNLNKNNKIDDAPSELDKAIHDQNICSR
jgi:hypothetical protein